MYKKLLGITIFTMPSANWAWAAMAAPELTRDWTSIEIVLSVGLLLFTLILIGLEAYIIIKAQKAWAPMNIVRLIGLTLILCIASFLVVAGYGKEQLSSVIGLLGVIAGYLLGANDNKGCND